MNMRGEVCNIRKGEESKREEGIGRIRADVKRKDL